MLMEGSKGGMEGKGTPYPCCLFVPWVLLDLGGPRALGYLWVHKNTSALLSSGNLGARTGEPTPPAPLSEVTHLESQGALDLLWGQR